MFCTFCGAKNTETNKFCLECGKPLVKPDGTSVGGGSLNRSVDKAQATSIPGSDLISNFKLSGKENMKRMATVGAVLVLICFFLPWLMVSCSFNPSEGLELSGYDMVTMTSDVNSLANSFSPYSYGQPAYDDSSTFFIVLVLAIPVCVGISLFFLYKPSRAGVIFFTVVAILALLFFSFMIADFKSSAQQDGIIISFRIGFWGTWIGLGLLIYSAFQLPSFSRSVNSGAAVKY